MTYHVHFWWNGFAWDEFCHKHEMSQHDVTGWSLRSHIESTFDVVLDGGSGVRP